MTRSFTARLTATVLLLALVVLLAAPVVTGAEPSGMAFRTEMSETQSGNEITVTVRLYGFHEAQNVTLIMLRIRYDDATMISTMKNDDSGALDVFGGLPGKKWENLSTLNQEEGNSYADIQILTAETDWCTDETEVVITLTFELKEGCFTGKCWIPADEVSCSGYYDMVTELPGEGGEEEFHSVEAPATYHSYTERSTDASHLVSAADCTHPAVYYFSCPDCGGNGTETFENGEALGHTGGTATCVKGAVCTRCKEEYTSPDPANHNPTGTATCSAKQVCSWCNQEIGDYDPSNHNPDGPSTCCHSPVCTWCHQDSGVLDPDNHEQEAVETGRVLPTVTERGNTGHLEYPCCHLVVREGEETPLLGDPNDDGKRNAKDYMIVKRYALAGGAGMSDVMFMVCNVNGDNKIDAKDYVILKRVVLKTAPLEKLGGGS